MDPLIDILFLLLESMPTLHSTRFLRNQFYFTSIFVARMKLDNMNYDFEIPPTKSDLDTSQRGVGVATDWAVPKYGGVHFWQLLAVRKDTSTHLLG